MHITTNLAEDKTLAEDNICLDCLRPHDPELNPQDTKQTIRKRLMTMPGTPQKQEPNDGIFRF
jgi:hypothetical protein